MKRTVHLLGFWLWIGFSGGAMVLLLIATPIESGLKGYGMPQVRIDLILSMIALFWVVASFMAARAVFARMSSSRRRIGAHIAGAAACSLVFAAFIQAGAGGFGFARADEMKEGRFTFGPYPDEAAIARLKQDGYTGVISLLSPLIPFEAVLLEKERKAVAAAGFEIVETPMLPWVSANRKSLDKLVRIASSGRERYYVHCYLGRHRVELARLTLLDAQGISTQPANSGLPAEFELGPILTHGDKLIFGPLPTPEEFFKLKQAGVRHIVCLLDPDKESNSIKVAREAAHDLNLEQHTFAAGDPGERTAAANSIRLLKGRIYVHGYRMDDRTKDVMAQLAP